jgi:hypothetical protein
VGFLDRLFTSGGDKERESALHLGIRVTDVERDIPRFDRRNKFVKTERESCTRYAIQRDAPAGAAVWSLLQRDGTEFPNGYSLISNTPPGDDLRQELRGIAEEFAEELFEFEGTANDVAVYWEEFGGQKMVERLRDRLIRLSKC